MDIETLVKDCQNGNNKAFGALYRIFSLPMMEVIGFYISNREAAKDILHDGFIIAYTSISSLKDAAKVESWLTTIMRNLALQYLRESASHISVPLSEVTVFEQPSDPAEKIDLTWAELEKIIDKLPAGYGKVFRLSVLDGLSHAEISRLLGISHLTSASQLHHAKALLRHMINKYRAGMGIISSIVIISLFIYHVVIRRSPHPNQLTARESLTSDVTDTGKKTIQQDNKYHPEQKQSDLTKHDTSQRIPDGEAAISHPDTIEAAQVDSSAVDSVNRIQPPTLIHPLIADHPSPENNNPHSSSDEWSVSLAYNGIAGHETGQQGHGAGFPSDIPGTDSYERQTVKYHPPVTFGVTVNRTLSERWSVESGVRYTYLRSDRLVETHLSRIESIERIHYLGIPVKIVYKIFQIQRLSVYGQAGATLDIPLRGTAWKSEWTEGEEAASVGQYQISAPVQWSMEGGAGLQYHLTPTISLYAEPSFRYYFNTGSNVRTIRQERPFELTLPIGIRMTW